MRRTVIIHPGQGLPQHRPRFWRIALVVVVAIGATAVFHHYLRSANAASGKSLARLAGIVGDHRLTRARLSGGFTFAPCQIDSLGDRLVRGLVCEGPPPTAWTSAGDLRKYAKSMRSSAPDRSGSPDPHGAGVWALVMRRADDAVAAS
jgi:hypothetical protein